MVRAVILWARSCPLFPPVLSSTTSRSHCTIWNWSDCSTSFTFLKRWPSNCRPLSTSSSIPSIRWTMCAMSVVISHLCRSSTIPVRSRISSRDCPKSVGKVFLHFHSLIFEHSNVVAGQFMDNTCYCQSANARRQKSSVGRHIAIDSDMLEYRKFQWSCGSKLTITMRWFLAVSKRFELCRC